MELKQFPEAIAKQQTEVHLLEIEILNLQKNIKLIELEVDSYIICYITLTNDAKRKTKRNQLLDEHPNYWELTETLEKVKIRRDGETIFLTKLLNEFSVAKLERRELIAKLELQLS